MSLVRLAAVLLLGGAGLSREQEYIIYTIAGGAPPQTPILGVDMPLGTVQSVAD